MESGQNMHALWLLVRSAEVTLPSNLEMGQSLIWQKKKLMVWHNEGLDNKVLWADFYYFLNYFFKNMCILYLL